MYNLKGNSPIQINFYPMKKTLLLLVFGVLLAPFTSFASEADLVVPDLKQSIFEGLFGINGWDLLFYGIIVIALGLLFGMIQFNRIKKLPVHHSMAKVSNIIYETCKTYLLQQGKFLIILFVIIGVAIAYYFIALAHVSVPKTMLILLWTVLGILGSYGVAWFGIRINTYANSRTSFAALKKKPFDVMSIPLQAGMSVGLLLICVELIMMIAILLFIPGESAGACFVGFAIGES